LPWEEIDDDLVDVESLTDLFIYTFGAVCTAIAVWVNLAVAAFLTEVVQKLSSLRLTREKDKQYEQCSEHEDQLVHLQGVKIGMNRLAEC